MDEKNINKSSILCLSPVRDRDACEHTRERRGNTNVPKHVITHWNTISINQIWQKSSIHHTVLSVDKDAEQWELSFMAAGSVNRYKHFQKCFVIAQETGHVHTLKPINSTLSYTGQRNLRVCTHVFILMYKYKPPSVYHKSKG